MTVLGILLLVALVFGVWAFSGRQSAKNNANSQAASAASAAAASQKTTDQAAFADQLKQPYKSFTGPATYGSIKFSYPKTWSAYVDQSGSSEPINGYFYPDIVPAVNSNNNTAFALRVELVANTYSSEIQQYQSQAQQGALKASAYVPAKLASTAGVQRGTRFDGTLNTTQTGSLIIIPVRDQTLLVYTESTDFLNDFNKIVLPSLTFSP